MKQKFYTLLLTAIFGLFGMNALALDKVDDVYQIGTAQDLMDFATLVNSGELEANAVLTADIDMSGYMEDEWTAIGDWGTVSGTSSAGFKGHFDGQGHTIKNFNFTASHNYFALFGVIWETALVENFTIEGNITVDAGFQYVAGVVAYTNNTPTIRNVHSKVNINSTSTASTPRLGGVVGGIPAQNSTTTIDRCTYSGTLNINDKGGNYGGIVGYILNNNTTKANITNCLFDGKLQGSVNSNSAQYGGIIGYTRKGIVSVKNCLSLGTFEYAEGNAMNIGQFVGRITYDSNTTGLTFANNYYKNTGVPVAGTSGGVGKGTAPVEVTAAQLASGEIAYLLNESVSGGTNWFQKLKAQTFIAEQYVVTVNGEARAPQTANTLLVDNGNGTYNFILPDFVLHTNSADISVGDVVLEDVTIAENGTFSKTGTFSVPDENIPAPLSSYKDKLQNLPYTLSGKVNDDKLYATITDLNVNLGFPFPEYAISVEIGTDDFTAEAPTGDAYPTPNGTEKVYANGSFNCDMTPKEGSTIVYSNSESSIVDPHNFVDGFCTVCGAIDKNYMAANANGFFEISNEKELVWFAAYVNQVSVAANAKLTENITLTKAWETPIGTGSGNAAPGATAYTGTFDGQGHTITGFNAEGTGHLGLFGDTSSATIKNFSISGNLSVTSGYGGGVVAWPINSTIENVHSALAVSVPNSGTHHVGGVVGSARGGNTISNCSFTGSLIVATGSTDNFAGIAAYITNGDNVTNCGNYGNITFSDAGCAAGGLIGYLNSTSAIIKNCLSVGTVTFNGEGDLKYGGAILGRTKNTNFTKITNNYWLEESAYGSSKNDSGVDALDAESSTAAQLASGEVGFNLGDAWSQFLGTDTYPKPGVTCPVFYVGAVGYATLFDNNNDWALNGDAQAYIGTANGQYIHLTAIDDIPMSTAVVIKGTYFNKLTTTATSDASANELLGTEEDTPADGTMYILAKPEGMEVGFYLAETGSTIPAGKAYYKSTSGAKGFTFAGDDATGIKTIDNSQQTTDAAIYNLAGQRLSKKQKGINIVGNKKVLF